MHDCQLSSKFWELGEEGCKNGNWSGTNVKSKGIVVTSPSITSMAHVSYSVAASCDWLLDELKGLKA